MSTLPLELLSNLRILGNWEISKKSLKTFQLMASPQPVIKRPNFDSPARKFVAKHSKETPNLLNFVNLSTMPCL